MIDEAKAHRNLDKLKQYSSKVLEQYFVGEECKSEYFEEVSCYNCGSSSVENSFTISRFCHIRCKECGMIYVNPRLKAHITEELYSGEPHAEYYKLRLIPVIDYRRNTIAVGKYRQIVKYFEKPGRVIELGCGLGEVLSVFKEEGWSCTGIELNRFATQYASKEYGLDIVNESIQSFSTTQKYDLVMILGVLEHLTDPMQALVKAKELLADDGLLALEVPSADSTLVRYYEAVGGNPDRVIEGNTHLMLFSVRSFVEMAQRAGFYLVELRSNGFDISTLNRLELNNQLNSEQVNSLQALLDYSLQGDALRGFFKKGNYGNDNLEMP